MHTTIYTYADLYATYALEHQATTPLRGVSRPWTREELVAILEAYVEDRGHYPPREDLDPECGLPHLTVVRRVFGSVDAWYAQVQLPVSALQRHCLKCGRASDRWVCGRCRNRERVTAYSIHTAGDGGWMSGKPITEESGPVDANTLDAIPLGPVRSTRRRRTAGWGTMQNKTP